MRLADKKIEKLFFDRETGLLARRTILTETVLGLNPEQTDYEDYRDADGAKIPFTVRSIFTNTRISLLFLTALLQRYSTDEVLNAVRRV